MKERFVTGRIRNLTNAFTSQRGLALVTRVGVAGNVLVIDGGCEAGCIQQIQCHQCFSIFAQVQRLLKTHKPRQELWRIIPALRPFRVSFEVVHTNSNVIFKLLTRATFGGGSPA